VYRQRGPLGHLLWGQAQRCQQVEQQRFAWLRKADLASSHGGGRLEGGRQDISSSYFSCPLSQYPGVRPMKPVRAASISGVTRWVPLMTPLTWSSCNEHSSASWSADMPQGSKKWWSRISPGVGRGTSRMRRVRLMYEAEIFAHSTATDAADGRKSLSSHLGALGQDRGTRKFGRPGRVGLASHRAL